MLLAVVGPLLKLGRLSKMARAAGRHKSSTWRRRITLLSAFELLANSKVSGGFAFARFQSSVRLILLVRSCRVARMCPNASGSVTPISLETQPTQKY